ncbi:MAG: mycofactocin biosynthesis chaperone MftB [Solirubrobacterales bacterium]|nr:mycofactocin biosynthesis chaperone MftB [Solirubrobacterales bacterium]
MPLATTARPSAGTKADFDLDRAWQLHPQVALRPESFGALAYHFGTRRLSFLKSPALRDLVESLADHGTARAACEAAGVGDEQISTYIQALATLATSEMIIEREAS